MVERLASDSLQCMKQVIFKTRQLLRSLSFRTGVVVAAVCVICYVISFAQMMLPVSAVTKGVLWTIFFGLAKTCQYTALVILGKAGLERLRKIFRFK